MVPYVDTEALSKLGVSENTERDLLGLDELKVSLSCSHCYRYAHFSIRARTSSKWASSL